MRTVIGKNAVIELLRSDKKIHQIFTDKKPKLNKTDVEILDLSKSKGINIKTISNQELDVLADKGRHQGWIATTDDFEYLTMDEIIQIGKHNSNATVVLLDGITDNHNLGAIIRTCECAGVLGLVIPERRAAQVNDTVSKTSAGAVEYLNIVKVRNINDAIDQLKDNGYWIYGADMQGDQFYYQEQYPQYTGLVIGSEDKGISRLTRQKCDSIIEIPMIGRINSLNASCAASILIYEILRQRGSQNETR